MCCWLTSVTHQYHNGVAEPSIDTQRFGTLDRTQLVLQEQLDLDRGTRQPWKSIHYRRRAAVIEIRDSRAAGRDCVTNRYGNDAGAVDNSLLLLLRL